MEWIFYRPADGEKRDSRVTSPAEATSAISTDNTNNNQGEGEEEEGGEGGEGDGEVTSNDHLEGINENPEGEATAEAEMTSSQRLSRLSGRSAPEVLMTPDNFASKRNLATLRPEFRPIFLNMNLTTKKLITYEVSIHKLWAEKVDGIRGGLKCPILIRDPGENCLFSRVHLTQ